MFKKNFKNTERHEFINRNREIVIKFFISGALIGMGIGISVGIVIARILA